MDDDDGAPPSMDFTTVEVQNELVSNEARIFAQSVQARRAAEAAGGEIRSTGMYPTGGLAPASFAPAVDMVALRAKCLEIAASSGVRDLTLIKQAALNLLTFVLEGR